MTAKHAAKPKWTASDRARHKAIRQEFEHCPTQEELEASGNYDWMWWADAALCLMAAAVHLPIREAPRALPAPA